MKHYEMGESYSPFVVQLPPLSLEWRMPFESRNTLPFSCQVCAANDLLEVHLPSYLFYRILRERSPSLYPLCPCRRRSGSGSSHRPDLHLLTPGDRASPHFPASIQRHAPE